MGLEALHGGIGDGERVAPLGGGGEEVLDEEGDVVGAIFEVGQVELHDGEAVVEVFAEGAAGDLFAEVAVGGGDDADVDRDDLVATDPFDLAALEGAEEFGLEVGAEFAELVEEEGAAAGLFEGASPARHRAREGAFDVAEEFGLDEVAGDGRAVEDDEGGLAARALLVDSLGDELLACAGAACDEQGDVGRRDALELAEDLAHEEAAADEIAEAVLAGDADLDLVFGGLEADAGVADGEGGAGGEPGLCDAEVADTGAVLAGEVAEAVAGGVDLDGAVAA